MEAEVLAATNLLTEAIYLKQVLQFLVGDNGGLSNAEKVAMRLRLDSTSAQAFFTRLGPGRAKHFVNQIASDTAGDETALVWSGQDFNKGESRRPEHQTYFKGAQRIRDDKDWIGQQHL